MGQYHYVCNLSRREYLDPLALGDGLKLAEFSNSTGGTLLAMAGLLATSNHGSFGDLPLGDAEDPWLRDRDLIPPTVTGQMYGRWAGDRIAVIGDYWNHDELDDWGKDPEGVALAPGGPWGNDKRWWADISWLGLVLIGLNPEYRAGAEALMERENYRPPRPTRALEFAPGASSS